MSLEHKPENKRPFGRSRSGWNNIFVIFKEIYSERLT
jgi:hypothetical protein